MSEPILMRAARREDVVAIVRMLADDPLGAARERYADPPPLGYLDAFEKILADPRNLLAVAEVGGEVVGCLQLTFIPGLSFQGAELALIEGVRVDVSRRGDGLGTVMIEWALDEARGRGCRQVELLTHASRADAQRFYARLGFEASHVGMKRAL
jgi:GNAT superfamily N-acetyltransferase